MKKTSIQNINKPFAQDLHDQAILASTVYNDPEMTQWIRERKDHDIDHIINQKLGSSEGITLLQVSASRGYTGLVKILLEAGADHGSNGIEPTLHYATQHDRADVIEALLERGADINSRSCYGRTPVRTAINHKNHEVLKLLARCGADLEKRGVVDKYTPLMLSASNDNHESISILLSFGADINATEERGNTALSIAVRRGHVASVRTLLEAGANINTRNKSGEKPFFLAVSRPDIVDLFLSRNLVSLEDCLETLHLIKIKMMTLVDYEGEKSLEMIHEYTKNKEYESEYSGLSL